MKNNVLEIIKNVDELNVTFDTDEKKICDQEDRARELSTNINQRDQQMGNMKEGLR